MHKNATFQMRLNAIKCSMLRMHHVTNAPRWSGLWECIKMRQNASYPKCSRSENASKCTQRENEECSCRECKQRGFKMHLNATNPRMQHEENARKCVQMYCNAQKCMRMQYVRNYTDLRKKLHHTRPDGGASRRMRWHCGDPRRSRPLLGSRPRPTPEGEGGDG